MKRFELWFERTVERFLNWLVRRVNMYAQKHIHNLPPSPEKNDAVRNLNKMNASMVNINTMRKGGF